MSADRYTLDAAATTVTLATFAEGRLARLAHDLELGARQLSGTATRGETSRAEVEVGLDGLQVVGAVKKGRVDPRVLSAGDRADIERRVRDDVFGGARTLRVVAEVEGARARLTVSTPSGSASVPVEAFTLAEGDGGAVVASGECALSMQALHLRQVKGPLGAFQVSDRVTVRFRAVFRRQPPAEPFL